MKELIDALHVIQDECKKHDGTSGCRECPLQNEHNCAVLEHSPECWKINDNIQRALL
jgi:hypothetical protein